MLKNKHRAAAPSPYDDCVFIQLTSDKLVVYSPTAGQSTVIAWPTRHGQRILAKGIKHWLRSRGLHWSCFCGLVSDTSKSTRIVETLSNEVLVFCHEYPSICGFSLNLTKVYDTATLFSEYDNLPTTASGFLPSMGTLLSAFLTNAAMVNGPYFEGYCGEHHIDYPDITQLSGEHLAEDNFGTHGGPVRHASRLSIPRSISMSRVGDEGHPYPNHKARRRAQLDQDAAFARRSLTAPVASRLGNIVSLSQHVTPAEPLHLLRPAYTSNAIAGPSRQANAAAIAESSRQFSDDDGPQDRAQEILKQLSNREGVPAFEMQGLLEYCDQCGSCFLASFLRSHIASCVEDLASK